MHVLVYFFVHNTTFGGRFFKSVNSSERDSLRTEAHVSWKQNILANTTADLRPSPNSSTLTGHRPEERSAS